MVVSRPLPFPTLVAAICATLQSTSEEVTRNMLDEARQQALQPANPLGVFNRKADRQ